MRLTLRQRVLIAGFALALLTALAALWWQSGAHIFVAGLGGTLC